MRCRYCTEEPKALVDKKISVLGMKTYLTIDVYNGRLELAGENEVIARKEIHFCPMCGRELIVTQQERSRS